MKRQKLLILCTTLLFSMAAMAEKIKVACIGDSITFGATVENRDVNSYPAKLQVLLKDKFEVKNFGNSGRGIIKTSMRGSQKRAFLFMKEHKAALEFKPKFVICNLGINDLMDFPKAGNDKAFVEDYKELLREYLTLPTRPRVFVWQPLAPLFKGQKFFGSPVVDQINTAIGTVVKEINKEIIAKNKKVSKSKRVPLVRVISVYDEMKDHVEWFSGDKIHPNAQGANEIAKITYKKVFKRKKK